MSKSNCIYRRRLGNFPVKIIHVKNFGGDIFSQFVRSAKFFNSKQLQYGLLFSEIFFNSEIFPIYGRVSYRILSWGGNRMVAG